MNKRSFLSPGWILLGMGCLLFESGTVHADHPGVRAVSFQQEVQPILRRHCYRCHGPSMAKMGIRFSSRETIFPQEPRRRPVIVKGKPEASHLYLRLTDNEYGDIMPPDAPALSGKELATIRRWIESGAPWPDALAEDRHWAYTAQKRPALPKVNDKEWARNAIDVFVLARLQSEGLTPQAPADRARLIRRVSLALIGLPPSVEEVDAFVRDTSPTAYEDLVDRLLRSQRYGEHWARHWLDLARYADSNGFQADQIRDSWAYRDWVIRAFNRNMPFDQFTIEQLAGDLLPNATADQKIATGFHRATTCNVEAGVHPEANRVNQVFDRVNTTGTVFLGTTIECCQCHDHKYDPFTQKDYYQLFAYFNNTPLEVKLDSGVQYDFFGPSMPLPLNPEQQAKKTEVQAQLAKVETQLASLEKKAGYAQWEKQVLAALKESPPRWNGLNIKEFSSTGGEEVSLLEDGSALVGGSIPGTSIYSLRFPGPLSKVIGFKLETLTHDDLPGKGPGRGDDARPNFILSEFTAEIESTGKPASTKIELVSASADFSQNNWDVAGAIDGDRKTGWAISPEFHKPHWAIFRAKDPIQVGEEDALVVKLDQNFGRGRTIGRVRLSVLTGDPLTADLSDELIEILQSPKRTKPQQAKLNEHFAKADPEQEKLKQEVARLKRELNQVQEPTTLVMIEMDRPRSTRVFQRGDYTSEGEPVSMGTPAVLHSLDPALPKNRLGLARWLVSPDNPLMARVMVNRWWGEIFGQGIVSTPEDFGTQGETPTHPELLDWLAVELIESGWNVKHVHKLMVTSATFMQSSRMTDELLRRDPQNRLLARGPRYRLSAEAIRDNALTISGLLSTKMYGEPIMPYQPPGIWKAVGRNQPKWVTATDEDRFRRGVYVVWKRGAPYPSFVTFDAPDRAACTVQRPRTNTPLQALTLLNDPTYAEMAVALAQRMLAESKDETPESRAARGFRLCVSRDPTPREISILVKLYHAERAKLLADPKIAQERLGNLLPRLRDRGLDPIDLAAWFAVANVLLNLDETITLG